MAFLWGFRAEASTPWTYAGQAALGIGAPWREEEPRGPGLRLPCPATSEVTVGITVYRETGLMGGPTRWVRLLSLAGWGTVHLNYIGEAARRHCQKIFDVCSGVKAQGGVGLSGRTGGARWTSPRPSGPGWVGNYAGRG